MKRFRETWGGMRGRLRGLVILVGMAWALGPVGAQPLDPNQLPDLGGATIHTDIAGQAHELPGAPFFPLFSFTLESNRQDDWSDPLLLGLGLNIREFPGPPPNPSGTPHIPFGAFSAFALAVDNPIAGVQGEFDSQDTIIERHFLHFTVRDEETGELVPIESRQDQVGWMFQPMGSIDVQMAGSRIVIWATDPNVGHPEFRNGPNDPNEPGTYGFGVYPAWVNHASLLDPIDEFFDPPIPMGGVFFPMDVIPTAEENFNQPRRYFVLLALTELMPDNAQVQVRLTNIDVLPSLNPVDDASGANGGPFIFPLRFTPAQLETAAAVLTNQGGHFSVVSNLGDTFYPGETMNTSGIPRFFNAATGQPGNLLPDSGPGYYPPFTIPLSDSAHRHQRIIIGPHQTPILHSQETVLQILALDLAANQVVGNPVLFGGFGLLFTRVGEYREILGDGIDNDGDAWMLQHNGLDDNLDGEDNDGNPATPNWADGIDNDGDGLTDEGIDDPMEGVDETFRLTMRGFNGIDDSPLDEEGNYQAELAPTPFGPLPIKDGIDNDGDGLIDEGIDELEEAIGLDPVQLAGRNDDKDFRTLDGLGIREVPFLFENGIDDDLTGLTDEAAEGTGPNVAILRYQANIFYNPDGSDHFYSDKALTGESIVDYVSRTFIIPIERGEHPDYPGFVRWATGPNNRLIAVTMMGDLPVLYPYQIVGFDNDYDNLYDEDPRDGMDNDGDGLIDEDVTWCPLIPAIDEEVLDYFVDGFTVFGDNRVGVYDEGADEYYIDFNMNGVFDQGIGDGDGVFLSEYRGGGRGFPSLRNGESYFQLGFVYPLDNDGDGEDNDNDPSTPPIANGLDDDGDGFTDEGFNEDVHDSRSDAPVFLNFDGSVPAIQVFQDNKTAGLIGQLDAADARMEVGAAPDPFNPQYIVVSMQGVQELLTLPAVDDFAWDYFVTLWLDSDDNASESTQDLFGNYGARYGDDWMIRVTGGDVGLTAKWAQFNYSVGPIDSFNNALSPDFYVDYSQEPVPQSPDGYPAGRLPFQQISRRQIARMVLEDMEGRGILDHPSSPLGGALVAVILENAFRTPPEPIYQFLAADLAHSSSNVTGPPDAFPEREFPLMFTKEGFPLVEPDGTSVKPIIGINVTDASASEGFLAMETIDQVRVNFVNAPQAFGRSRFEPMDLNPLRPAEQGDGLPPPGVALYMDRWPAPGGNADDDGDGEDNDNNVNTPAIADGIDNDGDGLTDEGINEDDIDFIDNDGDGLTDEDPPFRNIVHGTFDPGDVLVPINLSASNWNPDPNDPVVRGGGHYVILTPRYGLPIPPNDTDLDNFGYDFFVTVTANPRMDNYDAFIAYIRPGDILCSDGRNLPGAQVQTTPVKAAPPSIIEPAGLSNILTRNSRSIPVLGINTHDSNDMFDPRFVYDLAMGQPAPQRLAGFWLVFHEEQDPESNRPLRFFTPSDLAPLQNLLVPSPNTGRLMSMSGLAIYRDEPGSDTNGGFDDPDDPDVNVPDTPVLLSGEEAFGLLQGRPGAVQVWLDPPLYQGRKDVSPIDPNDPDPYEPLPPDDLGENAGADFFVVLRTSNTIAQGDAFYVSLTNPVASQSSTAPGFISMALVYYPLYRYHMLNPGASLLDRWDVSTQTGRSSQLVNTQPFDAAPTLVFEQPKFIPNQTVPTKISTSYTLAWTDSDTELDNDGDASTFPLVNLYYAPADDLSARVLINTAGPINGSLDGLDDQYVWDIRRVTPGVYRVLGTIDDRANPVVLALGGLVEVVNVPPDITLTAPVGENSVAGGVVQVRWTDADPENNAQITLYIVPATGSATGATDGILLATGISEDPDGAGDVYDVDLDPLLASGVIERGMTYFFLGSIDDGVMGPQRPKFSRSPGTITIKDVPTVRIVNPGTPALQDLLLYYDVTWTDRVPAGRGATLELFYSTSNFGYDNNVAVTTPIVLPAQNRIVQIVDVQDRLNKSYRWQVSDGAQLFPNRPAPGDYYIFGRITDNLGNFTGNFSAGRLRITDHAPQVFSLTQGPEYALESFTIRWAGISNDPGAKLALYYDDDESGFNGRLIARVDLGSASYAWSLYRNGDATQRNVPVGSYFLHYEVEDRITNAGGRYRFYSPNVVSAGVPAVEGPKVLLSDGQALDPALPETFAAGKSLLEGLVSGTPRAVRAVGSDREHPGLYVLDEDGAIYAIGEAPPLVGPDLSGAAAVDLEKSPAGGYYVLDRNGGVHAVGGASNLGSLYLSGGTARDLELTLDGKGAYVLESTGRIHRLVKTTLGYSFNLGAQIARDLRLAPDGNGVYVLDGYGGVHVAGSARRFPGPVFGSDIATDLWVDPSGSRYYILDKFGAFIPAGAFRSCPAYGCRSRWRATSSPRRSAIWACSGRASSPSPSMWTRPLIRNPDTDGDWVVWVTSAPGRPTGADISYARISDGAASTVSVVGDQTDPAIDGGVLVYTSREGLDDDIVMVPDLTSPNVRHNLSRNFSVPGGTKGSDNQRQPDVAVRRLTTGSGTYALGAVVWSAYDSTNREWDVYLQLIARDGGGRFAPVPGAILEISAGTNNSDQRDPTVAITDLSEDHATVMVVYSDNRNGDLDLVYALVQVKGSDLSTYQIEGGVLVQDLVRRVGAQVDPRVAAGQVIFTDEAAGGDIYAIRMNLADPRHPTPAGAEIAVATSAPRQFAGRVAEGDVMAWIDRYNSFFDVVAGDPRIAVFDRLFPGMVRPQTLGLVSPLNGFAEVYSLEYGDKPADATKWLVWSERREGRRRVVLYEQSVRPASAE
ncbi:hypothetical protein HS125_02505 [bacterium]|nr:hypothetical protein [bacterium]